MSLVFAGHIPNDPHLVEETTIPSFPQNATPIMSALSEIEGELYFMKPETVIFITEHQVIIPEMINMNIAPRFEHPLFKGTTIATDALLSSELKGSVEVQQHTLPLTIIAEKKLDDRVAASVGLMMRHITEKAKVIILSVPQMTSKQCVQLGEFLKREIMRTERRVALFSTGHLSAPIDEHGLSAARTLNHVIQKSIDEKRLDDIVAINRSLQGEAQCDSVISLSVLNACLKEINIAPQIFACETVGKETSMVLNCILQ